MKLADLLQPALENNPDLRGVSVPVLRAVLEAVIYELDEQVNSPPMGLDDWQRCEHCEVVMPLAELRSGDDEADQYACVSCLEGMADA